MAAEGVVGLGSMSVEVVVGMCGRGVRVAMGQENGCVRR